MLANIGGYAYDPDIPLNEAAITWSAVICDVLGARIHFPTLNAELDGMPHDNSIHGHSHLDVRVSIVAIVVLCVASRDSCTENAQ